MKPEYLIGGAIVVTAVSALCAAVSNKLVRREYIIKTNKLTHPLTVAHISDLHESLFGDGQCELIASLGEVKPDLVLITGDMIEDDESDPFEAQVITTANAARPLLMASSELAPTFMVLGNHESNIPNTDLLCAELEDLGVRVLHRRNREDPDMFEEVTVHGERILICGADDPYFDRREPIHRRKNVVERLREDADTTDDVRTGWRRRLEREYADIADDERMTLLLSHRPEEFELYKRLGFDAAFSGHAHGGQWRLPPFINGVYAPHQGFFPKHAGGCYRYEGHTHIVSRGLSKKRMVRIFNRPELCVARFVPQSEGEFRRDDS